MLRPLCIIKRIVLDQRQQITLLPGLLFPFKPLCTFFSFHLSFGILPSTVICNTALGMWGSQILFRYIRTRCIAFCIKCHLVTAFCQSPWRSQLDGQPIFFYVDFGRNRCRTHVESMSICALGLCECLQDVTQCVFVVLQWQNYLFILKLSVLVSF